MLLSNLNYTSQMESANCNIYFYFQIKYVLISFIKTDITCHDCEKKFPFKTGGFTKHIYLNGCKPYKCTKCQLLFRRKNNMVKHYSKCKTVSNI